MNKHRPKNRLSFVSNPKHQKNTSSNVGYDAPIYSPSDPLPSGNPLHLLFLLLFAAFFFILAMADFDEYVLLKDDGTYQLTDERKGKLIRELADLEEAEQYALRAIRGGMYPCFSCLSSDSIFLYSGEIWKYGITTKGQNRRYGRFLINMGLQYEIQYKGLLHDCLKEEKRKFTTILFCPKI